jgi:hypothetical protein
MMYCKGVYTYLAFAAIVLLLILPIDGFSQVHEENVAESTIITERIDRADLEILTSAPVHPYLNSINWMIVQPLDLSSAKITTSARSTASEVHFVHQCDDLETESISIPENGIVSDTLDTSCNTFLTTYIKAIGQDTTIQAIQTIDLKFLNALDN